MDDTSTNNEEVPSGTELSATGVIVVCGFMLVLVLGVLSPYIYGFYQRLDHLTFWIIVATSAAVAAALFFTNYRGPAPELSQGLAGLDSDG